ncbi:sialate O-acetylesterase [Massilia sp. DD77]|uniref:sialate O-acetylesterase n=1 Tax=Massilia sp. DD77 TaxID=3109349 RepID=UPI002FFFDE36
MPVARSSRVYPLTLKNDPLNVGILAAFDFAAENGSTDADNGKDHSGNARHFTAPAVAPLIVQTSAGKGRDTSSGRSTTTGFYYAAGAGAVGMAVGTGDFTIFKRIRTPSFAPAATLERNIGRITDGGGEKVVMRLYEVTSTGKWHWTSKVGASNFLLWNSPGAPGFLPNAVTSLHITRTAGVLKCFVDGVLIVTRNGDTTDFLATNGGSQTVVGNYGSSNSVDVVHLDEIYWSRGLSDAEVAAHAANPYDYYENGVAPNSIAISAPADGTTFGTSVPIAGTYAGAGVPTAIEASFNGGVWQVIDADPGEGTFAGTLTGQTPGTGTLSVRWANATSVTDTATGITVVSSSIEFTAPSTQQSAVPYRTFQRNASNQASVRISGTYTGTPSALQYRWRGGAWMTLDAAPTGGAFDKTITLSGPGQGDIDVRFANSTGVSATIATVGVGDVFMVMGQSNHVGKSGAYVQPVAPAANPAWVSTKLNKNGVWAQHQESASDKFDNSTAATYGVQIDPTPLGSYFGALATKIMDGGVPVAFVPCAVGSTSMAAWAASTDTTKLYGAAVARATQIGDHKAVLWWQGEADTEGSLTKAQFVTELNGRVNDWFTRFGRKWFVWAINVTGTGANFTAIHDAIVQVGQTNPNCGGYADLNGAFSSSVHYGTVSEINEIANRAFVPLNAAYSYVAEDETLEMVGSLTISNVTSSGGTLSWAAATGSSPATGYEVSINSGTDYEDVDNVLTVDVSGLQPETVHPVRVRAYSGSGLRSAPLSGSLTTVAAPGGGEELSFTPSPARTLTVSPTSKALTGGPWWNLGNPAKPRGAKDPQATLDVTLNWGPWLADVGNPPIAKFTATIFGVMQVGAFAEGALTTMVFSGATAAEATITFEIETATTPPLKDERTVYIDLVNQ